LIRVGGGHADQFVLIGGTAATLAMKDAGIEFSSLLAAAQIRKNLAASVGVRLSW
jgi:hypothetical protein